MISDFKNKLMSVWKKVYCEKENCGNLLGWSNSLALIVGGLLIVQPHANIRCAACSSTRRIKLKNSKNYIRYLSEDEVSEMVLPNLVENL